MTDHPITPPPELVQQWHDDNSHLPTGLFALGIATQAARWGSYRGILGSSPQPIPVSERLPGPEDCDAEGRCWWGEPHIGDSYDATWNLCTQNDAEEFCIWGTKCGWLPAHALPLPSGEVE